jgi:hypothetical protein
MSINIANISNITKRFSFVSLVSTKLPKLRVYTLITPVPDEAIRYHESRARGVVSESSFVILAAEILLD